MKAKVLSVDKISNAQVNITFQILKNDGTVLKELTRGFSVLNADAATARAQLIQSFKNIRDSLIVENASECHNEAVKLVGMEVDIA